MNIVTTAIHSLLRPDRVRVGLTRTDKYELIVELVDLLASHPDVSDLQAIRMAVLDREEKMSTGVGEGIALPHARTDVVSQPVAVLGISAVPVDFDAIDNKPVQLIFLLITPADTASQHIRLLSRISRLLSHASFREELCSATDSQQVIDLIRHEEERLFEH